MMDFVPQSEAGERSCLDSDWIRFEAGFAPDAAHPLVWCGVLGRDGLAKSPGLYSADSIVRVHFRSNRDVQGQGFQRWTLDLSYSRSSSR